MSKNGGWKAIIQAFNNVDDLIDELHTPLRVQKFWICYVEETNGGLHYRHSSLDKAQNEVERLARLPANKGKNVYLLECIGQCKKIYLPKCILEPVRWGIPR